jgi:hypothetical protein
VVAPRRDDAAIFLHACDCALSFENGSLLTAR